MRLMGESGTGSREPLGQMTKTLCLSFLACNMELIIASSLWVCCKGLTPGKCYRGAWYAMSIS